MTANINSFFSSDKTIKNKYRSSRVTCYFFQTANCFAVTSHDKFIYIYTNIIILLLRPTSHVTNNIFVCTIQTFHKALWSQNKAKLSNHRHQWNVRMLHNCNILSIRLQVWRKPTCSILQVEFLAVFSFLLISIWFRGRSWMTSRGRGSKIYWRKCWSKARQCGVEMAV